MKKMSEVFELPINHERLEVYGVGRTKLALPEVEKHAAHAINHVDVLADALEAVLKTPRGTSGRIILEKEDEDAVRAAIYAYRGWL